MTEPNPIQKLAIMVQSLDTLCVGLKRKTAILKYLVENEPLFSDENSVQYEVFKLYIKNFILPPPDVTTILLSTRFQLLINREQSRLHDKFVLDVYTTQSEDMHFNEENIRTVQDSVEKMRSVRVKDRRGILQDNIINRICDCVYSSGVVMWFDPFIEPYHISVKWDNAGYTVNSFKATKIQCQAAKGIFKNDFYTTYKKE